jgi:hypothetical protein
VQGCFRSYFFIPQLGEGLAFAKRTLPRKKSNTIELTIRFFASMAFVFLTPLPIRKVYHDKFFLASEFVVKPLVTHSFMDYIFKRFAEEPPLPVKTAILFDSAQLPVFERWSLIGVEVSHL